MKQHIEKYLPRNPVKINENAWYYYVAKGIEIIVDRNLPNPIHVLILWKDLEKALKLHKKALSALEK